MRTRTARTGIVMLGATLALLLTATAAYAALPVGNDDTATTTKNHAVDINVLANDTIPPGFQVTGIEIESDPQHGTATINGDNSIHYVPENGYVGDDSMMYNICYFQLQKAGDVQTQGRGTCSSTANVDITVTAPPVTTTTVPPTTVPATVAAVTTVPATAAPTTTVAAAATNELPRTGGGNGEAAAFGAIVVAAGLALVGGARYRRRHA